MLSNPPSSSGFSTSWLNAGDLQNKGVELSLNARPVTTRNFAWNTTFNFWLNRSLVTQTDHTIQHPRDLSDMYWVSYQIQQGASATQILGLIPTGIVKWGDAEPIFQMNTYNEITFQNKLSLRFLLHWKNGGQNVNLTNLENDFGGTSADWDAQTDSERRAEWRIPDQPGRYQCSGIRTKFRISETARDWSLLFIQHYPQIVL